MKRWLLHIWMIGMLGMLAASCSQEADGLDLDTDGKVQVMFTIALDNPSAGSRATWGDNYDDNANNNYESAIGDDFDNRINPDQFFVTLTLNGTTYDVQNIAHWQTANPNVYEFVGEVDVDIAATTQYTNAKIMVYANMNPNFETFTTNYTTNQNGVAYIPMWGVHTQTISLTPGIRSELTEPIYLLRAMAKVEVIMANNEFEIEDIRLNGYNTMGYNLPTGWNAATTTKTTDLDLEGVFRPISTHIDSNENFVESTTQSGYQCYTIYVPEYRNISNAQTTVTPTTITVTVGGKEYDIEFKKYTDGAATDEAYNIVRNHIYRFNITAVKTGMEFTLSVRDWTDVYSTLNYQDDLSYNHGSWTNNTKEGNVITLKNSAAADATDVTAVYSFQINTPQTIEWMAVLEDTEGKFQFDMSQTSGKGTVEGANAIQRTIKGELLVTGSNLKLGIKAINPSESGQYEATLRVYVTYGGKTIELDLTDGDESTLDHFTILHSKL